MIYKKKNIRKCTFDTCSDGEDYIVSEEIASIYINNALYTRLSCSPAEIEYLGVGFLLTEGIIKNGIPFDYKVKNLEFYLTIDKSIEPTGYILRSSGCGSGEFTFCLQELHQIDSSFKLKIQKLPELFEKFNKKSKVFKLTGGVHAAAISDGKNILFFSEDIGRHNAVDKVIGKAFLNGVNFSTTILLSSGRISLEIVKKAIIAGIPVVLSRSAPTSLAIQTASVKDLALIGFLRGKRFNIYSGYERIL